LTEITAQYEDIVPALLDELERQSIQGGYIDITVKAHECSRHYPRMRKVESPANSTDSSGMSSQGYIVYECQVCKCIWGCRYQYDPGTGSDDRWHNFGVIDPTTVKRHY